MTNAQKAPVDPSEAKKEALKANRNELKGSLIIIVLGLAGLFLQSFFANAGPGHIDSVLIFVLNIAAIFTSLFGLGIGIVQAVLGILIHFELIAELNSKTK